MDFLDISDDDADLASNGYETCPEDAGNGKENNAEEDQSPHSIFKDFKRDYAFLPDVKFSANEKKFLDKFACYTYFYRALTPLEIAQRQHRSTCKSHICFNVLHSKPLKRFNVLT